MHQSNLNGTIEALDSIGSASIISSKDIKGANYAENILRNKRGKISISREYVYDDPREEILKPLFENFFPAACDANHNSGMYNTIVFFGYSPHFREVKEGEVMPEYILGLYKNDDGTIIFSGFEEI